MSALLPTQPREKAISLGAGARATSIALYLDEQLEPGRWLQLLRDLLHRHDSSVWWIGDALAHGEFRYGEKYRTVLEELELSYDRARSYATVANNVPDTVRRKDLSWSHHRAVAALVPVAQEQWLARAVEERWSVRALVDAIAVELGKPATRVAVLEQIKITIDPERLERYTEAAARADSDVNAWAIAVLDVAAEGLL